MKPVPILTGPRPADQSRNEKSIVLPAEATDRRDFRYEAGPIGATSLRDWWAGNKVTRQAKITLLAWLRSSPSRREGHNETCRPVRPVAWGGTFLAWLAVALVGLAGCSQSIKEPSPTNKDTVMSEPPVETYAEPALKTEGSLFSDDSRMDLFADMKARRVGDIITINIVEASKASKTAATSTSRNNALTAQINHLMGYEDPENIPGVGSVFNSAGISNTGIEASYAQGFKGQGSTNRNENMTAKMSARIIQVLPNGNLVLRGSQEILVNNEKQYITIQGVVRPADVAADNSVLSTYLADARIDYTGEGDLSRKQREGWLSRFLDVVWPF